MPVAKPWPSTARIHDANPWPRETSPQMLSSEMLSPESTAVVKATAGVVAENSVEITTRFYPHMFAAHPELMRVFNKANQAIGEQPQALAASVVAYAVNLIDPTRPTSVRSCAGSPTSTCRWVSSPTSIRSSATTHVGHRRRPGDAVTPEIAAAWGRGLLALRLPAPRRGGLFYALLGAPTPSSRGAVPGRRANRRESGNLLARPRPSRGQDPDHQTGCMSRSPSTAGR